MREFEIAREWDGRRVERWLSKEFPKITPGTAQKFLREKRVRVNGVHAAYGSLLHAGDTARLFIDDSFLEAVERKDPFLSAIKPRLFIVYEDKHVMIVDKRPGMVCHPDRDEKVNTLITHAQAYLYQKGEYDSLAPGAFAPALCNRIDRFTGGLVMIAKTEAALKLLDQKIRDREVRKEYLCIVHGIPHPETGMLVHEITPNTRRVTVSDRPSEGSQTARTAYHVLASGRGLSLVHCNLLTGRTHQIRAQFAHIRHPLLGDNQYGDPRRDARFGRPYQALYAYRLTFDFKGNAGVLHHLAGRSFQTDRVAFVKEYFPDTAIE